MSDKDSTKKRGRVLQPKPALLFAFANDKNADGSYLHHLAEELREIRRVLEGPAKHGLCSIVVLPNATQEEVFDNLDDRVVLFHFAGHAGAAEIRLETSDGRPSPVYASGLAQLLGLLPALQLVFLNGCATEGQADKLLDAGVPTVIATSQNIADAVAAELAKRFYKTLASGHSIRKSFERATSTVMARFGPSKRELYCRSFVPDADEEPGVPWELYPDQEKANDPADPASLVPFPATDSPSRVAPMPPNKPLLASMHRLIANPKIIFSDELIRSNLFDKLLTFARERDIVFALGGAGSGLNTFTRQFQEHLSGSWPIILESADLDPEHLEQIIKVRESAEMVRLGVEVQPGAIVHLELKCLLTTLAYDIYVSLRDRFPADLKKGLGGLHFTDTVPFSDYYFASSDSEAMYKTDPVPIMRHFFETVQGFAEMARVKEVLVLMPWPRLAKCFRNNADPKRKNLGRALWKALGDLVTKLARPVQTPYGKTPSAFPKLDIYDKVCLIVCCSEVPYAHHAQKQRNLVARCIWPIPPLDEKEVEELVLRNVPGVEAGPAAAEIINWTGGAPWFVRLLMSYLSCNSRRVAQYDGDSRKLTMACGQTALRALEAGGDGMPRSVCDFIKRHQQAVEEALGDSQTADDSLIEQRWAGPLHKVNDGYRVRPYRLEAFVASGLIWLKGDPFDAQKDDYVFRRYPTVYLARASELPLAMYRFVTGNDVRLEAY